jgi:hypothetical protein
VAFWTEFCEQPVLLHACELTRWSLYVAELDSAQRVRASVKRVAIAKGRALSARPKKMAFSPDGKTIAYLVERAIYVKSLP